MGSKKALNAKNLEKLGAARLAELLIEISTGERRRGGHHPHALGNSALGSRGMRWLADHNDVPGGLGDRLLGSALSARCPEKRFFSMALGVTEAPGVFTISGLSDDRLSSTRISYRARLAPSVG